MSLKLDYNDMDFGSNLIREDIYNYFNIYKYLNFKFIYIVDMNRNIIIINFWALLFYSKALKWRKIGNNVVVEIDRLIVLHIMNKFEIFQNHKQNFETEKMFEKNIELYKYKKIEKIWQ